RPTQFMGSLHSFCARIGTMNLRKVLAARQRAADVSSAEPGFFCRQDAGSTLRFMESLHSFCARIGTMNLRKVRAARQHAADVSSAEPSFFCRQDAGSTLRFMESLHDFEIAHWDHEPAGGASVLASRLVSSLAPPQKGSARVRRSPFRF